MSPDLAQVHASDAAQKLRQLFVALGDSGPQLIAVHIEIIKQSGEALFGGAALG